MHGRPEYLEGFRAAVNPLPEHAYFDGWVGDRTEELIRRHPAEQPLFLFVGLPNPHIPFDAPEPYASMYDPAALPLPADVRHGTGEQAAAAPWLQAPRPQGELRRPGRGGAAPRDRALLRQHLAWWTPRWER